MTPSEDKVASIRLGNKQNPSVGGCWCWEGEQQTKSTCLPCTGGGSSQTVVPSVRPIPKMT